jgi:hypothetical protein
MKDLLKGLAMLVLIVVLIACVATYGYWELTKQVPWWANELVRGLNPTSCGTPQRPCAYTVVVTATPRGDVR